MENTVYHRRLRVAGLAAAFALLAACADDDGPNADVGDGGAVPDASDAADTDAGGDEPDAIEDAGDDDADGSDDADGGGADGDGQPDGEDDTRPDGLDCDADGVGPSLAAAPNVAIAGAWTLLNESNVHLLSVDAIEGGEWSPAFATDDGFELVTDGGPTRRVAVRFDAPGRYRIEMRVTHDCSGDTATWTTSIAVLEEEPAAVRATSSSVAFSATTDRLAVLSEDDGTLTLVGAPEVSQPRRWYYASPFRLPDPVRVDVCEGPAQLAWLGSDVAVTCPDQDEVVVVDAATATIRSRSTLRYGARPWGVVGSEGAFWVTLQGTGEVTRLDPMDPDNATTWPVIDDARAIAEVGDGRLLVSRWRASDDGNAVAVFDPGDGAVTTIALPRDDTPSSDTETGGVPTFVQSLAVSTREPVAYAGAVLANVNEGSLSSGVPLLQDTTLRAVLLTIDLEAGVERVDQREVYDDRGFASSVALTPASDYLYLTMRGSRTLERYDLLTGTEAGTLLGVGYAPSFVAVAGDDAVLAVDVALDRTLALYDATLWSGVPAPLASVPLVDEEPLDAAVLRGKQLFNDSFDQRLTQDGYIACAHCHLDGEHDGVTWDFSDRGEGIRSTIMLRGRAGDAHGLLHWSANFDEVQDFEHDLRGPFGGRGLMSDAEFADGRELPLGEAKAGVNEELDALAAYVSSLTTYPRSPHRTETGELTEAAVRGRALFESAALGCTSCHAGATLTDSGFGDDGEPILHDVGTLSARTGSRLGGPIDGIDTPTLHGVFATAPYLHDGSAPTLRGVLTSRNIDDTHGSTSELSDDELDDLVAYLRSLDGRVD